MNREAFYTGYTRGLEKEARPYFLSRPAEDTGVTPSVTPAPEAPAPTPPSENKGMFDRMLASKPAQSVMSAFGKANEGLINRAAHSGIRDTLRGGWDSFTKGVAPGDYTKYAVPIAAILALLLSKPENRMRNTLLASAAGAAATSKFSQGGFTNWLNSTFPKQQQPIQEA